MNVTMEKIGNVNGTITVSIEENDYQAKVKKELKQIGIKYPEKGFRPGHVPAGLLQKKYGKEVLLEVVNRDVYDAMVKFIEDNKINILGEPLVANADEIDFDKEKDFTFKFEVGMSPEINLTLDNNISIPYYTIEVDKEMVDKQNESLKKRFGKQEPGEEVDETALVKGSMVELNEDGTVKDGGMTVESTIVSPQHFKNEDQKALFIGKKKGEEVVFNPSVTCDGNLAEMASMLNIDKDNADNKSDFKLTIKDIVVVKDAELGQEFFDSVFGKDEVKSEEEYFAKLNEIITNQLQNDSNYRFTIDAEKIIKDKVGSLELPSEFLKKWLLKQDSKRDASTIDEDFDKMIPGLEWQLIKEKIAKDLAVKVEDKDLLDVAKMIAYQQFAQYGMTNMPEDVVEKYAKEIVENKDYRQRIIDKAVEDKLFAAIKGAVKLDQKTVAVKDFNAMFEAEK